MKVTIKTKKDRGFVVARFFISGKPTRFWDRGTTAAEAKASLMSRFGKQVFEEAKRK